MPFASRATTALSSSRRPCGSPQTPRRSVRSRKRQRSNDFIQPARPRPWCAPASMEVAPSPRGHQSPHRFEAAQRTCSDVPLPRSISRCQRIWKLVIVIARDGWPPPPARPRHRARASGFSTSVGQSPARARNRQCVPGASGHQPHQPRRRGRVTHVRKPPGIPYRAPTLSPRGRSASDHPSAAHAFAAPAGACVRKPPRTRRAQSSGFRPSSVTSIAFDELRLAYCLK